VDMKAEMGDPSTIQQTPEIAGHLRKPGDRPKTFSLTPQRTMKPPVCGTSLRQLANITHENFLLKNTVSNTLKFELTR
jgi:hypothetical protein